MAINWPMPMGDGNQGWMSRGGQGAQSSWPQPAGEYGQRSSTPTGRMSPTAGFGEQPAMRNPDNMGFAPPAAGPASQWTTQAPPLTYGAAAPGSPQFTYQRPLQQTGYGTPEQSAMARTAMGYGGAPGGGQVGYGNEGQRALYAQGMAGRQAPSPGMGRPEGGYERQTNPADVMARYQATLGAAPQAPAPTAGPMSMLGGMNSQQLQNILPMLQQLFASRGQGGPGGQSGLYGGPPGGPQFPPEGEPVVPPWQGMAGAQTTPAANGVPGYTTVPGPWTGAAPTGGGMGRGGYERQTNPADVMARYQETGGAAPQGHVAYGTPEQSAMVPGNQQGYGTPGQSAMLANAMAHRASMNSYR